MTIEAEAITQYKEFVALSLDSFLPLFGAVAGIFIAFAIANMARFLIMKMVRK